MNIPGIFTRKKPATKGKKVKTVDNDPPNVYLAREQQRWSSVCLPLSGVILLGLGIALIVVASVTDITDLIIIGAIALLGSLVFFIMLFFSICRPMYRRRRQVENYETLRTPTHSAAASRVPNAADYSMGQNDTNDLKQARNQPGPSMSQLYGNRRTPSLPPGSPVTATDVRMHAEDDTPPPPRLALPSDPNDTNRPTFSRTVHTPQQTDDEVSDLALL